MMMQIFWAEHLIWGGHFAALLLAFTTTGCADPAEVSVRASSEVAILPQNAVITDEETFNVAHRGEDCAMKPRNARFGVWLQQPSIVCGAICVDLIG